MCQVLLGRPVLCVHPFKEPRTGWIVKTLKVQSQQTGSTTGSRQPMDFVIQSEAE